MARNRVELALKIFTEGQAELAKLRNLLQGVKGDSQALAGGLQISDAAFQKLQASVDKLTKDYGKLRNQLDGLKKEQADAAQKAQKLSDSFATQTVKLLAYAAVVKELTIETAKYAARTETLAVVTDRIAKVNNLSQVAVQGQVQAVRKLGISTQEAYTVINKMIFAQLDLKKSTDLARLAQDAAVIAGVNSSQALDGIVHGIVTRQTDVLRTYGIVVDFENAYKEAARGLGRELTGVEKQQIALNAVLAQGAKITGTYEASMFTAGKQLTSLTRHIDEARNAIGQSFVPALSTAVRLMGGLAKYAEENSTQFAQLASGITAASTAALAFKYTPGGPVPKAAVAAVVGGVTYALGTQDPIESLKGEAGEAITRLRSRQRELNAGFNAKTATAAESESYKKASESLASLEQELLQTVTQKFARLYKERAKSSQFEFDHNGDVVNAKLPGAALNTVVPGSITLGDGITISQSQVLAAASAKSDPNGALFNQKGYEEALARAKAAEAAEKAEKASKEFAKNLEAASRELTSQRFALRKLLLPDDAITGKTAAGPAADLEREQALSDFKQSYGKAGNRFLPELNQLFDQRKQKEVSAELKEQEKILQEHADAWRDVARNQQEAYGKKNLAFYTRGITERLEEERKLRALSIEQERNAISRQAAYSERVVLANGAQGREGSSFGEAYQIRLKLAEQLFQRELDAAAQMEKAEDRRLAQARALGDLRTRIADAEYNREQQILELQQRRLNEYREAFGRIYDATRDGGGLKGFIEAQRRTIERTIFQNIGTELYKGAQGSGLRLPQASAESPLGRILRGTPFEAQAAGTPPFLPNGKRASAADIEARAIAKANEIAARATTSNTSATDRNTSALDRLTQSLQRTLSSGGTVQAGAAALGSFASSVSVVPGSQVSSTLYADDGRVIAGGSTSTNGSLGLGYDPAKPQGGSSSLPRGIGYNPDTGTYSQVQTGSGRGGSSALKGIGTAAGLATAGFGVYSGIKQGGARGASNALASGLAGAALLAPSPATPFLLAGALGASVIGSLLGDPKAQRQAAIDKLIERNRYAQPESIERFIDRQGRDLDFDRRGATRVIKTENYNLNIDALDARSLLERAPDIADAVRDQIVKQHPVADEIRQHVGAF